jgi:hypothetical protein
VAIEKSIRPQIYGLAARPEPSTQDVIVTG